MANYEGPVLTGGSCLYGMHGGTVELTKCHTRF